jgi:hypothetical protein
VSFARVRRAGMGRESVGLGGGRNRVGRVRFTGRLMSIVVVALGLSALTGCTSARDTLGTNSSPCFSALALAKDAVHGHGMFAGVRLVSESSLVKLHHVDAVIKQRSTTRLRNVCLVAYRGDFRPSQVMRAAGKVPASGVGHFAVVVISTPQNKLLATFVLEKEPVRFRHLALGHSPTIGTKPAMAAIA